MKALTIGGAMIDTIAVIASDRIERMTMLNADHSFLLLEEGRKTEAMEISTHCGGGAVNTAVSMARQGLDVSTIVKLGRDQRAETVLSHLMSEGVSTRWVLRAPDSPTGASVLIAAHDRNAAIFTFRGANTLLSCADLKDDAFMVDVVYVTSLSNQSADCFPDIVAKAKAAGALVAANPGVRQLSARGPTLIEALKFIDILAINRNEADALVPNLVARFGEGGPTLALKSGETPPHVVARGLKGGGFDMSLVAFVKALTSLGVTTLLLTDGRQGAFVGTAKEILYCPVLDIPVSGTAGAGDAFTSTFTTMIAKGASADDAVRTASINAASVLTHVDTQTGLLKAEDLAERLKADAKRMQLRRWKLGE